MFRSIKQLFRLVAQTLSSSAAYLHQGWRAGLFVVYLRRWVQLLMRQWQAFNANLAEDYQDLGVSARPRLDKLRQLTGGLHAILPKDERFSYSILISLASPTPSQHFEQALQAALQQTAPELEVLVAVPSEKHPLYSFAKTQAAACPERLKVVLVEGEETVGLNHLAALAKGNYLLVLEPTDVLRPDFLFRCEQLLHFLSVSDKACVYTDEYTIDTKGQVIPGKMWQKASQLVFPYQTQNAIGHTLLVPKALWLKVGGVQIKPLLWDLAWRLEEQGAQFHHLPFCLYAHREGIMSEINTDLWLSRLHSYTFYLNWQWTTGPLAQTYRPTPPAQNLPAVQVIIPFKDQKELTLRTIESVKKQKGVRTFITAVDNQSDDQSIAAAIIAAGGEILSIAEPFNYSRLNNLAVQCTKTAQQCPYLLFLNNDVELADDALIEMCRWIEQPRIGLVGAQLFYPTGQLQHGGIELRRTGPAHQMVWVHTEKGAWPAQQNVTQLLRLTDAVTAACALMKREVFLSINGFDEIWYPIAYSDTNLAIKLQAKDLLCLYTPEARGVHHESVSRQYANIEDVEISTWLHDYYFKNKC